jgi:hypothetical protein
MHTSEIAQLRQRIDQEIAAMNQAKQGYAAVARHEVITHHLNLLGVCLEQLTSQVGKKAAVEMLAEQLEREL